MALPTLALPTPRPYFPLSNGRYVVEAGLKILGQQPAKDRLSPTIAQDVATWIMERLILESPQFFQRNGAVFRNLLAGLEAKIDADGLKVAAFRHLPPLTEGPRERSGAARAASRGDRRHEARIRDLQRHEGPPGLHRPLLI